MSTFARKGRNAVVRGAAHIAHRRLAKQFLDLPPTNYVDVGSAGGLPRPLDKAIQGGLLHGYLVDPVEWGPKEKARSHVTHVPHALGHVPGEHPFWVAATPGCSSCLEPNFDTLGRFPVRSWFDVKRVVSMPLRRADELWATEGYGSPHLLKIDVQGFERQVIEGFGDLMGSVCAIELESHFVELYRGQTLLPEMLEYLADLGFYLRHLEPHGPFEGELIEANTYWVRRDTSLEQSRQVALWEDLCGLPERPVMPEVDLAHYAEQ